MADDLAVSHDGCVLLLGSVAACFQNTRCRRGMVLEGCLSFLLVGLPEAAVGNLENRILDLGHNPELGQ